MKEWGGGGAWEADQCWDQKPVICQEPRLLPTSDGEADSNQKDAQGRDKGSNCDEGLGGNIRYVNWRSHIAV